MDGNNSEQIRQLRKKGITFASQIRTSSLSHNESWHAFQTTILKTLEYPMEAINLSKQEWDYIMTPILQATLPKAGIVRTFPRSILYASKKFSGLGILHPYYHQQIKHLHTCLEQSVIKSITKNLIHTNTEQLRLELGFNTQGYWFTPNTKAYLTPSWTRNLFAFCDEYSIQLIDTCSTLSLRTTNDRFLMQIFQCHYQGNDLCLLHQCCEFLQVLTVSDIATADGIRIDPLVLNGTFRLRPRHRYTWPNTPNQLSNRHWNLWSQAIQQHLLQPNQPHHRLLQPTGIWTDVSDWLWFFSPSENRIYQLTGIFYTFWSIIPTRTRRRRFQRGQTLTCKPQDSVPATVLLHSPHLLTLTGTGHIDQHRTPDPVSLSDYIAALPPLDQWASTKHEINDDGHDLARGITKGTATAISDGSYKQHYGTSCSILRGTSQSQRIISINAVPGPADSQSAYRSELAGISGSLLVLQALCNKYNLTTGSITIGLDGKSAIDTVSSSQPLKPQQPDFDLLCDIRTKLHRLPITVNWVWIKGHQDDHVSFQRLSPIAQDNVIANNIAKAYAQILIQQQPPHTNPRFPDEGWTLYLGPNKQTRFHKRRIYDYLTQPTITNYWSKKWNYPTTASIDWPSLESTIATLPSNQQRRISKHTSGHFGCGTKLLQWGHQDHDLCPICNHTEDLKHILLCPHPRSQLTWQLALSKLEAGLKTIHTDPNLIHPLITALQSWHSSIVPPALSPQHPVTLQQTIGWYVFLHGQISTSWQKTQATYFSSTNSKKSPRRWTVQFIKLLLNISWDMWSHRNGFKHSPEGPNHQQLLNSLQEQIHEEYDYGQESLLPRDKHWLQKPIEVILAYDPATQQQWLKSLEYARERFHNQPAADPQLEQQRTLMQNWLQQPPPQP